MTISIRKYLVEGYNLFDKFNFLVLRYARIRPLNGKAAITKILHYFYPELILRSKKFKGLKLVLNPSEPSHMKITDEFFLDPIYNLNLVTFTPDHIIDCGAHIGMFTLLSAGFFPSTPISCFEPNIYNIKYLKKQLQINNLSNVSIYESAVSSYDGETSFSNPDGSTYGGFLINDTALKGSYKVKVKNLIQFIKDLNVNKLLLKIDVEGEEQTLIPLLIKSLPKECIIYFEYHFGIESFKKFEILFKENGFKNYVTRIVDDKYIDAIAVR